MWRAMEKGHRLNGEAQATDSADIVADRSPPKFVHRRPLEVTAG